LTERGSTKHVTDVSFDENVGCSWLELFTCCELTPLNCGV